jgi:hypothetical protein
VSVIGVTPVAAISQKLARLADAGKVCGLKRSYCSAAAVENFGMFFWQLHHEVTLVPWLLGGGEVFCWHKADISIGDGSGLPSHTGWTHWGDERGIGISDTRG